MLYAVSCESRRFWQMLTWIVDRSSAGQILLKMLQGRCCRTAACTRLRAGFTSPLQVSATSVTSGLPTSFAIGYRSPVAGEPKNLHLPVSIIPSWPMPLVLSCGTTRPVAGHETLLYWHFPVRLLACAQLHPTRRAHAYLTEPCMAKGAHERASRHQRPDWPRRRVALGLH